MIHKTVNISESQIEDALVLNLKFLQQLISSPTELTLIARQLRLNQGKDRIDLLLLNAKELLLIELKITPFATKHIDQILTYHSALEDLQQKGELLEKPITNILLVTQVSDADQQKAENNGVRIVKYDPLNVLINYFVNVKDKTNFMTIKPNDYGVMSLYLIIPTLVSYAQNQSITKTANEKKLSTNSIKNHLYLAKEFGLTKKFKNQYVLTDLGYNFIENNDEKVGLLSEKQINLLKEVVAHNPYYSPTVYGIYSILESAFILSRNSYPIEFVDLKMLFKIHSGKNNQWNSERTLQTTTYTFINFAANLGLMGKFGKQIVITPAGFSFILMLQLHKSIKMIDNLN